MQASGFSRCEQESQACGIDATFPPLSDDKQTMVWSQTMLCWGQACFHKG